TVPLNMAFSGRTSWLQSADRQKDTSTDNGHKLQANSYKLLAVSFKLQARSFELQAISYQRSDCVPLRLSLLVPERSAPIGRECRARAQAQALSANWPQVPSCWNGTNFVASARPDPASLGPVSSSRC